MCAKGTDLPNEPCIEPGNCQVQNMIHSTFGVFLHRWVQEGRNKSSIGRNQLTSTWFGLVVFFFPKILAPNLTTRTNYQNSSKNCGQSSLATAGHCSRRSTETYGKTWASGRPGSSDHRVGVGLWLQLLEESLVKAVGQQPVKLLHGHYGSAGNTANGKRGFGQH